MVNLCSGFRIKCDDQVAGVVRLAPRILCHAFGAQISCVGRHNNQFVIRQTADYILGEYKSATNFPRTIPFSALWWSCPLSKSLIKWTDGCNDGLLVLDLPHPIPKWAFAVRSHYQPLFAITFLRGQMTSETSRMSGRRERESAPRSLSLFRVPPPLTLLRSVGRPGDATTQ